MSGFPPPPVPSTAAPIARSSRSFSVTCRNAFRLQLELADSLDADPRGAARQVTQRNLFDVDDMDGVPVCTRGDRLVDSLLFCLLESLVARLLFQGEDPVHLAAHLRDRRADRIGHREMLGFDQLRSAS